MNATQFIEMGDADVEGIRRVLIGDKDVAMRFSFDVNGETYALHVTMQHPWGDPDKSAQELYDAVQRSQKRIIIDQTAPKN